MATFDKPGRGRKQCPGCNMYTGVFSASCEKCGHDFGSEKQASQKTPAVKEPKKPALVTKALTEPKTIKTYDEPGALRKQCPDCNKYVHSSVPVCICGNEFKKKAASQTAAPAPKAAEPEHSYLHTEAWRDPGVMRIHFPAGECPVKLKGTTIDEVAAWADAVRKDFLQRRMFLTLYGLIYFSREFHAYKSPEFVLVKEHLHLLFDGENQENRD